MIILKTVFIEIGCKSLDSIIYLRKKKNGELEHSALKGGKCLALVGDC
jgi:hypothetical protein